ncbi:phosphomevalonate kinase-like [Liolophura sinensis]|uniref:phosphomevalonate kinase-like n=1 Tax=Liolophura sinensis TaxID=3198878 RepID=UPI003158D24B
MIVTTCHTCSESKTRKMTSSCISTGAKKPQVIFVFSGKRKTGKDFITDLLRNRLKDERCAILRLSGPLKEQYAKDRDLDFQKLLDASSYKEKYRADMIVWGEEKRKQDPGYFCRLATSGKGSEKPVWIISDARRKTDVDYFREHYPKETVTVRITADLAVREKRDFVFTAGIDDAESECGLDEGVEWDEIIKNNGGQSDLDQHLDKLVQKWCS